MTNPSMSTSAVSLPVVTPVLGVTYDFTSADMPMAVEVVLRAADRYYQQSDEEGCRIGRHLGGPLARKAARAVGDAAKLRRVARAVRRHCTAAAEWVVGY